MAVCRHFGPCGGCDWQHLSYAEQLARKRQVLTNLLRAHLGRRAPDVHPVIGMQVDETGWPWRFRHKASFVFGHHADGLTIGHFAAGSRQVVPIVECPVHTDRANRLAFALHGHLARSGVTAAGPDLRGVLRHLIVRTARDGGEAVAMLVVSRNDKSLRAPIREFLAGSDTPTGFFLNIHSRSGPYMVGRETIRLHGRGHLREQLGETSFLVSPTSFFQTNAEAAATLIDLVLARAPARPRQTIVDLYAGSGLFALPLAARGHRVTAVEENEQAVEDAEANLKLNRLSGGRRGTARSPVQQSARGSVRLIRADIEEALPRLARDRLDLAVLDPPRQGCSGRVVTHLFGEMAPRQVVYVSCNPEALAAELPVILDFGYRVESVQPVDMFPHTTHIETVVTLRTG